jgi:putative oxidoreductase
MLAIAVVDQIDSRTITHSRTPFELTPRPSWIFSERRQLMESSLATWRPQFLSLLRIASGLLFLQHGTAKWLSFPAMPQFANISITTLSGAAGAIELVVGVLLVLGLFTRPAAFIASGLMAAAYFIAHAQRDFFPILNRGELAALYCFVFLYLAAAGGGAWSLDRALRKLD